MGLNIDRQRFAGCRAWVWHDPLVRSELEGNAEIIGELAERPDRQKFPGYHWLQIQFPDRRDHWGVRLVWERDIMGPGGQYKGTEPPAASEKPWPMPGSLIVSVLWGDSSRRYDLSVETFQLFVPGINELMGVREINPDHSRGRDPVVKPGDDVSILTMTRICLFENEFKATCLRLERVGFECVDAT